MQLPDKEVKQVEEEKKEDLEEVKEEALTPIGFSPLLPPKTMEKKPS